MAQNFVTACVCASFLGTLGIAYAADPSVPGPNRSANYSTRLGGVTNVAELWLPWSSIDRGEQILLLEEIMGLRPAPTANTVADTQTPARVPDAGGEKMATDNVSQQPAVHFRVTQVDQKRQMLELSIITDIGIRGGHQLDIYRGGKYLGRLEMIEVSKNRASARVLPAYQRAIFHPGDEF